MDFVRILSETFLPVLIYSFCAHFNPVRSFPHPLLVTECSEEPSTRLSSLTLETSLRESSTLMSYLSVWVTSPGMVLNLICGATGSDFTVHS